MGQVGLTTDFVCIAMLTDAKADHMLAAQVGVIPGGWEVRPLT